MRGAGHVDYHGSWRGGITRLELAILAGCLLSVALYRMRLRRVKRLLAIRSEERLAERIRIRQELTILCCRGCSPFSCNSNWPTTPCPPIRPARPRFDRALAMLRQVVDDSRRAVRGIRSPDTDAHELEAAFSRIREEFQNAGAVDFRVVVDGRSRPLNPLIRDEVYRIGRAALANAFRHSGSSSVEMEIAYGAGLRVAVRDAGLGFDALSLGSGLIGMRNRAERIGAQFQVWNRREVGTEVVLTVPGHIAFPPDDNPNEL